MCDGTGEVGARGGGVRDRAAGSGEGCEVEQCAEVLTALSARLVRLIGAGELDVAEALRVKG